MGGLVERWSREKEEPYDRLLNWGHRRDLHHREKVIEKELKLINPTRSLSKEKVGEKLNRSM